MPFAYNKRKKMQTTRQQRQTMLGPQRAKSETERVGGKKQRTTRFYYSFLFMFIAVVYHNFGEQSRCALFYHFLLSARWECNVDYSVSSSLSYLPSIRARNALCVFPSASAPPRIISTFIFKADCYVYDVSFFFRIKCIYRLNGERRMHEVYHTM